MSLINKTIANLNIQIEFNTVPNMDAEKNVIWKDFDAGIAEHHNEIVSIWIGDKVIPVDTFFEIVNEIRELESKTIIKEIEIDNVNSQKQKQ